MVIKVPNFRKILTAAAKAVIAAGLFVSVALTFYSFVLRSFVFSEDHYKTAVVNDKYVSEMKHYISEYLENDCGMYMFPTSRFEGLLEDEQIRVKSVEMLCSVYNALLNNGDYTISDYDSSKFEEAIMKYVDELDDGAILKMEEIHSAFIDKVDETIDYSLNPLNLKSIRRLFNQLPSLIKKGSGFAGRFPLYLVLSIVFTALSVIFMSKSFPKSLYYTCTVLFCGVALCFVPTLLISNYDVPARLAIVSMSPLRTVVSSVWYSYTGGMMKLSIVMVFVAGAAVTASSIYAVYASRKAESNDEGAAVNAEGKTSTGPDAAENTEGLSADENAGRAFDKPRTVRRRAVRYADDLHEKSEDSVDASDPGVQPGNSSTEDK